MLMTSSHPMCEADTLVRRFWKLKSYAVGRQHQQPNTKSSTSQTAGEGARSRRLVVVYGLCETVDSLKGP